MPCFQLREIRVPFKQFNPTHLCHFQPHSDAQNLIGARVMAPTHGHPLAHASKATRPSQTCTCRCVHLIHTRFDACISTYICISPCTSISGNKAHICLSPATSYHLQLFVKS